MAEKEYIRKKAAKKKSTALQKKLQKGPVMSIGQYNEWLKEKKSLYSWKIS